MLEHVDIGWNWLKDHLDQIIDEVNQNKPLPSTTIAIDANTSGSMLRVIQGQAQADQPQPQPADTPWKITPDGETAGWHLIVTFDAAQAIGYTQWVWGGTPKPSTHFSWTQVTVIDPGTCTQHTITILVKP